MNSLRRSKWNSSVSSLRDQASRSSISLIHSEICPKTFEESYTNKSRSCPKALKVKILRDQVERLSKNQIQKDRDQA